MKMKSVPLLALLLAPSFCATNVLAQTIGISFLGRSGGNNAVPSRDTAGVLPQANWINVPSGTDFDGFTTDLVTSAGTFSLVSFEWEATDSWNSPIGTGTPDFKLMKGIQKVNPDPFTNAVTGTAHFRWHNLPTGSTFNAIVYHLHNSANAKASTRIGTNLYYTAQRNSFDGTFTRSTSTSTNLYDDGNYVQFDNVQPDSNGTLEIEFKKLIEIPEVSDGAGVPALQLELVSGNNFQLNDAPPTLIQEPDDYLGIVGDIVTFSIGTDGPWFVHWYTNGVSAEAEFNPNLTLNTTAAMKDIEVYAVVSNAIGTVTSQTATLTLDDPGVPQLVQGFLHVEHYGNIAGTSVSNLYANVAYQSRNFEFDYYALGSDIVGSGLNNFGRIIEGWVRPPVSGDYRFFTRSDDASEFFVNPVAGTGPGSIPSDFDPLTPDAFELACCNPYQEPGATQTTTNFTLTAGEYYAIAGVYKEGGGGDFYQLAWREEGDTTPAANLSTLLPEYVYTEINPAGKRASITEQPQSVSLLEGAPASFSVAVATLPDPTAWAVQWFRDGVLMGGQAQTDLVISAVTAADDGAEFFVKVYNHTGTITSEVAVITVLPDILPPAIVSAGTYPATNTVGILFNEPIDPATGSDTNNYSINGGAIGVLSAEVLSLEDEVVILTLDANATEGDTVTVSSIADVDTNIMVTTNIVVELSNMIPQTLANATNNPIRQGRSAYLGGDNFYIEAGGSDIWGNRDAGYMVTTNWTGSFDMVTRLHSLDGPNTWTKAGIMIRETTDGGSRHTWVLGTRTLGQNLMTMQWRDVAGAGSGGLPGGSLVRPVPYPNAWLRLVRESTTNNVFDSYISTDGTNWTVLGSHTIPDPVLSASVTVGMAVTSHDNGATAPFGEGLFRSFSITGDSEVLPIPLMVTPIGMSNYEITWDPSENWILQTTTNVLTGPWLDLPAVTPPVGLSATNRVDYYRLKIDTN